MKTRFLNVDLELRGPQPMIVSLAVAFEPAAVVLNCMAIEDGYFANLELANDPSDAAAAVGGFVALIENLPPPARVLWEEVTSRQFSIGVEAGSIPGSFEVSLTPIVVRLAATVGAGIVFVVYATTSAPKK